MLYALICLLFLQPVQQNNPAEATVSLKIQDVRSTKGNMSIAVYTAEDDFMSRDDVFKAFRMKAKTPLTETQIKLPPGRYAIAVYHDVDNNEKLAKNWIGMPSEPVGISNNAIGMTRPTFEEAAFEVKPGGVSIEIDLLHF